MAFVRKIVPSLKPSTNCEGLSVGSAVVVASRDRFFDGFSFEIVKQREEDKRSDRTLQLVVPFDLLHGPTSSQDTVI